MTFKPGDVARLKSGGAAVTVLSVAGEMVKCVYFSDENGIFQDVSLPLIALELIDFDDDEEDEDEDF
jgi:uncharacterized protein YodC (DUF2158 family)